MTSKRIFKAACFFAFTLFSRNILTAQEVLPLPDGCGNPFSAPGTFGDFFEKTIRSSVIENGAVSQAHVQLFAVNRIRKFISEKFPNPSQGDAVDRHIAAQVCAYAKDKMSLNSTSVELHKHLLSIAPQLLRDVKKVSLQLQEQLSAEKRMAQKYESRLGLIDKAEDLADKELNPFLTKF